MRSHYNVNHIVNIINNVSHIVPYIYHNVNHIVNIANNMGHIVLDFCLQCESHCIITQNMTHFVPYIVYHNVHNIAYVVLRNLHNMVHNCYFYMLQYGPHCIPKCVPCAPPLLFTFATIWLTLCSEHVQCAPPLCRQVTDNVPHIVCTIVRPPCNRLNKLVHDRHNMFTTGVGSL